MNFTVLMCVYAGDALSAFSQALSSCTTGQKLKPKEVIILRNGPVSVELEKFLCSVENNSIRVIRLEENLGLARALNIGLAKVSTPWIARMDADDISLPYRFEKQIAYLTNHPHVHVLGTALQEFKQSSSDNFIWGTPRILPTEHNDLNRFARLQSPIHHPTVMIRTSTLKSIGGYPENSGRFEDYVLWERLLLKGYIFENLPDILLGYRVDSGSYTRRGGLIMFKDELHLQSAFLKDGFITPLQYVRNLIIRGFYRLIPTSVKKPLYRLRSAITNKA